LKKLSIILIILSTLSIFSLTSNAFAYTTGYQANLPPFTKIPTVCAIDPNDPTLSAGRQRLLMDAIQNGVSEWSSQLGASSPHPNNWNIQYKELTQTQARSFSYSTCDVVIVVNPTPDSLSTCGGITGVLGCERYIPNEYKLIQLYYDYYSSCVNSPTGSGICPISALDAGSFENVVRHEFGHALGLGHYVSDDPKVILFWTSSPNDVPSIMIPSVDVHPQSQKITEMDIQKVRELYNYVGFTAFTPKNINPFTSLTANAMQIEFNGDQTPIVAVSAQISQQYYSPGQRIEFTITDQEGHDIFDTSYITTNTFNENLMPQGLIPGTYTLSAKYAGMSGPDVSFNFSYGGQSTSNTQLSPSSTMSSTTSNPFNLRNGNIILVDGTNYSVQYSITNGKILGIKASTQSKALITSIQTTGSGVLTVTLPRGLIDAKVNSQDDPYYVLNDGQEADFQETSTTTTDRTLSIPFTDGTEEMEIVGTQIVPEFGSMVEIIITISIIGSIVISRRFSNF
jgi:hypothetical protein